MLDKSLADRYANALFAVAQQKGVTGSLNQELQSITEMIEQTPSLRRVLFHPAISAAEKQALAQELMGNRVSALALRFLALLFEAQRIQYLGLAARSFDLLYRRCEGRLAVRALSAHPIGEDAARHLEKALTAWTGKKVDMTSAVDKRLLGGVRLEFEDHNVLDGSIARRLESLRERILAG